MKFVLLSQWTINPFSTYLIQNGTDGPVKIGKAVDPKKRLKLLQCGNPNHLRLVGALPFDCEENLHERFAQHGTRMEWHNPAPEIFRFFENASPGELPSGDFSISNLPDFKGFSRIIFQHVEMTDDNKIIRQFHLDDDDIPHPSWLHPILFRQTFPVWAWVESELLIWAILGRPKAGHWERIRAAAFHKYFELLGD